MNHTNPAIPLSGQLVELFYPWRVRALMHDGVVHLTIDGAVRVAIADGFAHAYIAGLGRIIQLTDDMAADAAAIKEAVIDLRGER